jgi:hypothetical protein
MGMRMERIGFVMTVPDAENAPPPLSGNSKRPAKGREREREHDEAACALKSEQFIGRSAAAAGGCLSDALPATGRVLTGAEVDTRLRQAQGQRDAELTAAFAVARMMGRRKRADETFMDFATALLDLGDGHVIAEPFFVAAFVNGLDDQDTARLLRTTKPQDLRSAAKEAIWLRRSDGAAASKPQHEKRARRSESDADTTASTAVTARSFKTDCTASERVAHAEPALRASKRHGPDQQDWKRPRQDEAMTRSRRPGPPCCFMCGEPGHYARECPQREFIQREWIR